MAKLQQDELLKLRSELEKERKRANEQSESFQGDLQRVLTRVAEKESELQASIKNVETLKKNMIELEKERMTSSEKMTKLEQQAESSAEESAHSGKVAAELRAAQQTVAELTLKTTELEKKICSRRFSFSRSCSSPIGFVR